MSPKSAMEASTGSMPSEATKGPAQEQLMLENHPKAAPTSYGPIGHRGERDLSVNPFWSEKTQEDVAICSLRPKGLPELDGQEIPAVPRPAMGGSEGATE